MRLDWSVGVVSSGKSNNNQDNNTLTMRAVSTLRTVDLESKRKALEAIVGETRWSQTGVVLLCTEYSLQGYGVFVRGRMWYWCVVV